MAKKCGRRGPKGAPSDKDFKNAAKTAKKRKPQEKEVVVGGAMYKWSFGDVVINILAYTQGAYPSKDVMSMAEAIWKKQAGPKMTLIDMETLLSAGLPQPHLTSWIRKKNRRKKPKSKVLVV